MNFINRFQEYAVPIAVGLIAVLGVMVMVLLITYLVTSYKHQRDKSFAKRNQKKWQNIIIRLITGKINPADVVLSSRERIHLRDLFIDALFHREMDSVWDPEMERSLGRLKDVPDYRQMASQLYVDLGFVASDIKELADRRWWRRVKAIERLEDAGITRAGDEVLARLSDKRREVRFTALRFLALTGSEKIQGRISDIFSASSTWSYLYLVNILYQAKLPLKVIETLAKSENTFQRKAAATLLGSSENEEAVKMLALLAEDPSPEVRREAVFSLARIGSSAAIPVFWRRVADESSQVRAAIAKGIGDIGHLVLLQELVEDDSFEVRFQAFASLSRLGMVGKEVIKNYEGKYKDLAREFLVEANHA